MDEKELLDTLEKADERIQYSIKLGSESMLTGDEELVKQAIKASDEGLALLKKIIEDIKKGHNGS